MLGLCSELQRGDPLVGTGPARTTTSDGPAGRSIATSRETRSLASFTYALPGPQILSTRGIVSVPYAKAAIAGGPPSDHTSSIAEQLRGRGDEPRAVGRRRDDDPVDARDEGGHRAHDERRDETARHVDADRAERKPASLELDAGPNLEPNVGRPLRLVPAPDVARRAREPLPPGRPEPGLARAGSTPSRRSAHSRNAASPRTRTS